MVTGATQNKSSNRTDPDEKISVCPFTVLVDTREQAPWRFTGIEDDNGKPLIISTSVIGLATGDYSIGGMENSIAIERKSFSDFRSSITAERDRFEREMIRLSEMEYAAIVIEADWRELLQPDPNSKVSPKSIARTIQSWSVRYGVHFWTMPTRHIAEVWTFRLLQWFWKQRQHVATEAK